MPINGPKQGLGILLPIQRGNTGYFNQGFSLMTQAKSNLINLVLTQKGERVMNPDFGCNLRNIIFEPMTDDLNANIKGVIVQAAKIWMPSINILDVTTVQDTDLHQATVTVSFNVAANPAVADTIQVKF